MLSGEWMEKKMSGIKKLFFVLLSLCFSIDSSFAGCLDKIPTSEEQMSAQVKIINSNYSMILEREKMYLELAQEAGLESSNRKLIAGLSVAPLLITAGGTGAVLAISADNLVLLLGAFVAAAPAVGDIGMIIDSLSKKGYSTEELSSLMKTYEQKLHSQALTCSYQNIHQRIEVERQEVLETELSGSLIRTVGNRLSLGTMEKKSLLKLLALTSIQKELLQNEMAELQRQF